MLAIENGIGSKMILSLQSHYMFQCLLQSIINTTTAYGSHSVASLMLICQFFC